MKHNVILIGFMGSGKTSVGERLAERLGYQFRDTDRLIEQRAGDTIHHIFAVHGEEYFRSLETDLLKELKQGLEHSVLSTGGGLPLKEMNSRILKEMGFVVYLKASGQTTLQRLAGDTTRPLLQGEDKEQKIEKLLIQRAPIYEKAAHKVIVTDDRSVNEISDLIMEAYMKLIY